MHSCHRPWRTLPFNSLLARLHVHYHILGFSCASPKACQAKLVEQPVASAPNCDHNPAALVGRLCWPDDAAFQKLEFTLDAPPPAPHASPSPPACWAPLLPGLLRLRFRLPSPSPSRSPSPAASTCMHSRWGRVLRRTVDAVCRESIQSRAPVATCRLPQSLSHAPWTLIPPTCLLFPRLLLLPSSCCRLLDLFLHCERVGPLGIVGRGYGMCCFA